MGYCRGSFWYSGAKIIAIPLATYGLYRKAVMIHDLSFQGKNCITKGTNPNLGERLKMFSMVKKWNYTEKHCFYKTICAEKMSLMWKAENFAGNVPEKHCPKLIDVASL